MCFCVDCRDAQGCGKADRTALIAGSFACKTTILLFGLACNFLWLIVLIYYLSAFVQGLSCLRFSKLRAQQTAGE